MQRLMSRANYMRGACTHREYYSQFITNEVLMTVENYVGKDNILKSKDPFTFKDLDIRLFDALHPVLSQLVGGRVAEANGGNSASLSDTTSIAKEAARQIRTRNIRI